MNARRIARRLAAGYAAALAATTVGFVVWCKDAEKRAHGGHHA